MAAIRDRLASHAERLAIAMLFVGEDWTVGVPAAEAESKAILVTINRRSCPWCEESLHEIATAYGIMIVAFYPEKEGDKLKGKVKVYPIGRD